MRNLFVEIAHRSIGLGERRRDSGCQRRIPARDGARHEAIDLLCGSVASACAVVSMWSPYPALEPSARRLEFSGHIPTLAANVGKRPAETNLLDDDAPRAQLREPASIRSSDRPTCRGDFTAVLEAAEAFVDGDYT